jgi:hypothetical protein
MKPNRRYDHAWAVVRLYPLSEKELSPDRVVVVRVFWSRDRAEKEAQRMNQINADKDCLYFSTMTRVERE